MEGIAGDLSPPHPINATHDVSDFTCGNTALDEWLKAVAFKSEGLSARTYVVCDGVVVVGYYSLATGSVARTGAPGAIRRNMPDPLPVVILARLAVSQHHQGQGIGTAMLRDAFRRALQVADIAGCRAVLLHAIDDVAVTFYASHGFQEFPSGSRTMFLSTEMLRHNL